MTLKTLASFVLSESQGGSDIESNHTIAACMGDRLVPVRLRLTPHFPPRPYLLRSFFGQTSLILLHFLIRDCK